MFQKATLEELHRREYETQKGIADEALQQVEMTRLKGRSAISASIYNVKEFFRGSLINFETFIFSIHRSNGIVTVKDFQLFF